MTWSCTASHFFGGTFHSRPHFYGRSFRDWLHFYGRTYSNPKMHKHEENTKKRRRKHERNTQFCVFFVWRRRKSTGKNSPLIGVKNQWAKLDHWNQRVKMTRWNQSEPLVWLKTNHTTSCQDGARLKLYRRLRRGGTQKCHLVIFSKNLLTKSDLCVILL